MLGLGVAFVLTSSSTSAQVPVSPVPGVGPLNLGPIVGPPVLPRTAPVLTAPNAPTVPIAQPNGQPNGAKGNNNDTRPALSLGECIAIALERQPTMKAALASQRNSAAGQTAINNIGRIGQAVSPDLPIRKEQTVRGQIAAAADIQKVHNEIVYDVTRMYYTVVYAQQQEKLADDVVESIGLLVKLADAKLKSGMPGGLSQNKLDVMTIGLKRAEALRLQARSGSKQAYAALREAMGVDAGFSFRVRDTELPIMDQKVPLTAERIVEMALAQRPEMALATAGVDAFRLEVYAQARIPFRRSVPTLASGSDIHSRQLPQGSREKDYRPGALLPEMPPQLVGSKYDRVCRAMALSERAEALYEKTRDLVALEAEVGFYTLEYAAGRLALAKEQFNLAKGLRTRLEDQITEPQAAYEVILQGYVVAVQAQSDYLDAVHQYILALAALERITAGGIKPGFPGRRP